MERALAMAESMGDMHQSSMGMSQRVSWKRRMDWRSKRRKQSSPQKPVTVALVMK